MRKIELFRFLSDTSIKVLERECSVRFLPQGEILFRDGDIGRSMFVVLRGRLEVVKNGLTIATNKVGDFFGEMALLESKPRSATLIALDDVELLEITGKQFYTHLVTNPNSLMSLLKTMSGRNRENLGIVGEDQTKLKTRQALYMLYRKVLDDTSNEIFLFDLEGLKFVQVNQRAQDNLGYTEKEFRSMTPVDIIKGLSYDHLKHILDPLRRGAKEMVTLESTHLRKDGSNYPVIARIQRMDTDTIPMFVAVVQDASERQALEDKIRNMSFYDSLTGLPNRNLAMDRLIHSITRAKRHNENLAVFMLDMDNFKTINDSLGHCIGDSLLKDIGKRLIQCLRKEDTVARLGGDEFIILLTGLKNNEDSTRLAQKSLETLSAPFEVGEHEIYVTFSLGISLFPNDGSDPQALMTYADAAMNRAKECGKSTFEFYDPALVNRAAHQMDIERGLRKAIQQNEFLLYYQPKVDLQRNRIIGVEALIRWTRPDAGMIAPDEFIPVAESSRLIIPIGEWVLRTACEQLKSWQERGIAPLQLSVNLSGRQFSQSELVETVETIVKDTGIDPQALELELTETVLMDNSQAAIDRLKQLNSAGYRFSIDDFGTGYSSLLYLKQMPIHCLKIDRQFVHDVSHETGAEITKVIVNLAQTLKMTTIAEGVETEEQKKFLQSIGCHQMQGYLFSHPLPAEEMTRLLQNGKGFV